MADSTKDPNETPNSKNSNKKVLIIVGVIIAVVIVLSIVGTLLAGVFAKKASESVFEAATGNKLDINKDVGSVTIKGDDGEKSTVSTGDNVELPDDFPKFVPIYDGAKLVAANSFRDGEGEVKSFSLSLTTKDKPSQVFKYYEKAISKKNGYKVLYTSQSAGISQVRGMHIAEKMQVGASTLPYDSDGLTTLQLSVIPKED